MRSSTAHVFTECMQIGLFTIHYSVYIFHSLASFRGKFSVYSFVWIDCVNCKVTRTEKRRKWRIQPKKKCSFANRAPGNTRLKWPLQNEYEQLKFSILYIWDWISSLILMMWSGVATVISFDVLSLRIYLFCEIFHQKKIHIRNSHMAEKRDPFYIQRLMRMQRTN